MLAAGATFCRGSPGVAGILWCVCVGGGGGGGGGGRWLLGAVDFDWKDHPH